MPFEVGFTELENGLICISERRQTPFTNYRCQLVEKCVRKGFQLCVWAYFYI